MTGWQRVVVAVGAAIVLAGLVTALRPFDAQLDGQAVSCGVPLAAVESKDPDVLLNQLEQLERSEGELGRPREPSAEDLERLEDLLRRQGRSFECNRRATRLMERAVRLIFVGVVVAAAGALYPALRRASRRDRPYTGADREP